ncbi:hypothetical protein D3C84_525760 [compost metagenome]
MPLGPNFGKIAHPTQQAVGNTRRATCSPGNFERAFRVQRQPENAGRTADDGRQVRRAIELQTLDDTETVAQRIGQHPRARGRPHQGERRQVELDGAGSRPLTDHDVELEVLHGRVQHFLDNGRQAMDFIDEQHIVRFQVGQQRRQIARPF